MPVLFFFGVMTFPVAEALSNLTLCFYLVSLFGNKAAIHAKYFIVLTPIVVSI
jgi:hypothetical protein